MTRFNFSLGKGAHLHGAGEVVSDSFHDALEAIVEQADVQVGDVLEIGVEGFPPARYELVKTGRRKIGWRPQQGGSKLAA